MTTHRVTRNIFAITALTASVLVVLIVGIATTSASPDSGLQELITDADPAAVDIFSAHAPDVVRAPWCDLMMEHHDDWDGFRASIAAEADAWATDEVGMLAQVGVAMAATCPGEVEAFAATAR